MCFVSNCFILQPLFSQILLTIPDNVYIILQSSLNIHSQRILPNLVNLGLDQESLSQDAVQLINYFWVEKSIR